MAKGRGKWYVDFCRAGFYHDWALAERFERAERETDFIVEALGLPAGAAILDLCCGEGRHTVALARCGYRMTGLDLSALHLRYARRAAREAGVAIRWHRGDMRDIPWQGEFDAVINMFTAFGYFDSDAEDAKVLDGIARALKPRGKFLIDFINRERVMRQFRPKDWEEHDGRILLHERHWDLATGRNHDGLTVVEPDGSRRTTATSVRMYTYVELKALLVRAGFGSVQAWGGFDGSAFDLDSRRLVVLSEKLG